MTELLSTSVIPAGKRLEINPGIETKALATDLGLIPPLSLENTSEAGQYYQKFGRCLLVASLLNAGVEPTEVVRQSLSGAPLFRYGEERDDIWPSTAIDELLAENGHPSHTQPEYFDAPRRIYSLATMAAGIIALGVSLDAFCNSRDPHISRAGADERHRTYVYSHIFGEQANEEPANYLNQRLLAVYANFMSVQPDGQSERIDPTLHYSTNYSGYRSSAIALQAVRSDRAMLPGMEHHNDFTLLIEAPTHQITLGNPGGFRVLSSTNPILHSIDQIERVLRQI